MKEIGERINRMADNRKMIASSYVGHGNALVPERDERMPEDLIHAQRLILKKIVYLALSLLTDVLLRPTRPALLAMPPLVWLIDATANDLSLPVHRFDIHCQQEVHVKSNAFHKRPIAQLSDC